MLSTRRLEGITRCDATSGLLEAGAGTTLASAQRAAGAIGYELGIDLAARESATLGGMVATNAGGIHVLRHGSMRARVAGLEAVLADGSVVRRMDGLWKDNVGWDLVSLLAGSEGTLAVLTAVAMRLVDRPLHRVTALVAIRAGGSSTDLGTGSRHGDGARGGSGSPAPGGRPRGGRDHLPGRHGARRRPCRSARSAFFALS